jgi:membrane-bound lytic murein transglycosylase A
MVMSEEHERPERSRGVIATVPEPHRTGAAERKDANFPAARTGQHIYRSIRYVVTSAGMIMLLFGPAAQCGPGSEPPRTQLAALSVERDAGSAPRPEPLRLPDAQLEPINWNALKGWAADDHAAALTTFLASCRPLLRTIPPKRETRPMYFALRDVCRRALAAGQLTEAQARLFFERNFRPLRLNRLGESAGLLTGYYEPIVDGSRFPTGIFKVPIYRRPPDLVPPLNSTGPGFPNRGQSLRRTASGELVPYYDRGEILDGALDGKHLEICWIKDQEDALLIQIEGSARIRLEDGTILRINYDAHNGYPFVPVSRILIERNLIPHETISLERVREWMRANPQSAEELRRQNRFFMFFRIVGLSDEWEAVGAQGVPLTPGRSIAVDPSLHVFGTPFFIRAGLPLTSEGRAVSFGRLMIAQDTGSTIVGPARADLYWGAGDWADRLASRLQHPGSFAMLVPRELDPVAAGARMPLPLGRPPVFAEASTRTTSPKSQAVLPHPAQLRRSLHDCKPCTSAVEGSGPAKQVNASCPLSQCSGAVRTVDGPVSSRRPETGRLKQSVSFKVGAKGTLSRAWRASSTASTTRPKDNAVALRH